MELNAIYVSVCGGEDGGVVLLDVMPKVDTVLCHGYFPDVIGGYVAGALSTWCELNDPSAKYRPAETCGCCCIFASPSAPGSHGPT
jgi:hypothetical protein